MNFTVVLTSLVFMVQMVLSTPNENFFLEKSVHELVLRMDVKRRYWFLHVAKDSNEFWQFVKFFGINEVTPHNLVLEQSDFKGFVCFPWVPFWIFGTFEVVVCLFLKGQFFTWSTHFPLKIFCISMDFRGLSGFPFGYWGVLSWWYVGY